MENKKTYLIYDLGCSAALISIGHDLFDLERTNTSRVGFIFEYSFSLQKDISDYWGKKLSVDARTINENVKALKTRIYSEN